MLQLLRAGCAVSAFLIAILGPGALVVAGDDGPARTARADRPTRTTLRPTELPDLAPPAAPVRSPKEAIILVSGVNSSPQDPTFDALVAKLLGDPRYVLYRFGADPDHPYDALGDLDVNARNLGDEVRALGATHPAVHIIAHSMGGVVADRAFSHGLSAKDGVATYVALASPHNGSSSLAATTALLRAYGDGALEARALLSPKLDPGSDAARGLAAARPVRPPAGVVRLDLRMSTDWAVTAHDAKDPGVESRTLTPSDLGGYVDGHGAVTRDPEAIRLITSTIGQRAIPADRREWPSKLAAGLGSLAADRAAALILFAGLLLACCITSLLWRSPLLRVATRPLAVAQLRAVRRK